jgi:hypothetical protein
MSTPDSLNAAGPVESDLPAALAAHSEWSASPIRARRPGASVGGAASGPSGLSDYAVCPLGVPAALFRDEVRVAFLGRTSTEDQQDPRQSLIRQLASCRAALSESW